MLRRNLSANTVETLKGSRLWRNLCSDSELQPEIRDDSITVYYCSSALVRDFKVTNGSFSARIHQKYLPPPNPSSGTDIDLIGTIDTGLNFSGSNTLTPLGMAEPSTLDDYKAAMDRVLGSDSEGRPEGLLVQSILDRLENQIIDQEIAFQEPGDPLDKIDLCHYDSALNKLVFIEVKRKEDSRLTRPASRPEVLDQLAAYGIRLQNQQDQILTAYRRVVELKRELGLGKRIEQVPIGGPHELVTKPALVIGNCSRTDVRDIFDSIGEWKPLMSGIREVAAGFILCGDYGCRLNLTNGRQSKRFIS